MSSIDFVAHSSVITADWANDVDTHVYGVKSYGTVAADGVTDDTATFQAALNAISDGILLIPPGSYKIGTLTISNKANGSGTGGHGGLRIEATGAVFVGDDTGDIIIDSSKRVQINGLDAPSHDLIWRGCWWSNFSNTRFMRLVIGDSAGASFSSNYWNKFDTCVFQSVITNAAGNDATNAITFDNCSLRGNTNQGFTTARDYAIELLANQNTQDWEFINCDISYHTLGIYSVGAGNTTGQIELSFISCYFDDNYPAPLNRTKSRITTERCHAANNLPNAAVLPAVARGGQDSFRHDKSASWARFSSVNFIPNGDFRDGLLSYVGTGLPLGSAGGATITASTGAGPFNRYLNINQAGTSGTTRFRTKALPFNGRYTGTLLIRNAGAGSRTIRLGFNDLFYVATISDSEWTLFTMTSGTDITAGTQPEVVVLTDDATAFNVDVGYVAVTFGEGGPPFSLSSPYSVLTGSVTYNPPSLVDGAREPSPPTITVTGAALGDFVVAAFSLDTQGVTFIPRVSSSNTVTVEVQNETGGTIDLNEGTLYARVFKNSY